MSATHRESPAAQHRTQRGKGHEDPAKQEIAAEAQEKEIQNRTSPSGEIVYGAVFREGEHELHRSNSALAWSGLAAGLSMGFSFVAEAMLRAHLPDAPWVPVVTKMGYAVGFLIVILGRQQLFTKNTLTVMLPLLNRAADTRVRDVARLWAIVLFSNLLGAFLFAWFISAGNMFDHDMRSAFVNISRQSLEEPFLTVFLRSILAGWLIALMIWLLPFAESARVWVIALLAYVVGLGHFPHIIAGSIPAFYQVVTGGTSLGHCLAGFTLPVLLGNIIGGVALVAAAVHAEFLSGDDPHTHHSSEKHHVPGHSRKTS